MLSGSGRAPLAAAAHAGGPRSALGRCGSGALRSGCPRLAAAGRWAARTAAAACAGATPKAAPGPIPRWSRMRRAAAALRPSGAAPAPARGGAKGAPGGEAQGRAAPASGLQRCTPPCATWSAPAGAGPWPPPRERASGLRTPLLPAAGSPVPAARAHASCPRGCAGAGALRRSSQGPPLQVLAGEPARPGPGAPSPQGAGAAGGARAGGGAGAARPRAAAGPLRGERGDAVSQAEDPRLHGAAARRRVRSCLRAPHRIKAAPRPCPACLYRHCIRSEARPAPLRARPFALPPSHPTSSLARPPWYARAMTYATRALRAMP